MSSAVPAAGWELWKTIAYPGKVVVPGDSASAPPRVYHLSPSDFHQMARTGNAKLRDSWNIPLAWEHQNVTPHRSLQLSADARRALGVFGKASGFKVSHDGRLLARLRGRNAADLEQFKNVEFVSPEIQWDWRDTDGHVWHGPTITHVAATPRPIQRHQESVEQALRGSASNPSAIRLSLTSKNVGSTLHPTRLRLSLSHYVGNPTMPANDEDLNTAPTTDTEPKDDIEKAEDDAAKTDAQGKETNKKGSPWSRIAIALESQCGLKLGDVSDVKNAEDFATRVEIAALNFTPQGGDEPDLDDDDEDMPEDDEQAPPAGGDMQAPPAGAAEAQAPPIQMSLAAQTKQAETFARSNLNIRIGRLSQSGRVTPAIASDLTKQLKAPALRLSFAANGELASNSLTTTIAAYEKLPRNSAVALKSSNKSGKKLRASLNAKKVKAADESPYEDDGSEKDTDAAVAAYEKTVGRG